jgi:hypothetical protein
MTADMQANITKIRVQTPQAYIPILYFFNDFTFLEFGSDDAVKD